MISIDHIARSCVAGLRNTRAADAPTRETNVIYLTPRRWLYCRQITGRRVESEDRQSGQPGSSRSVLDRFSTSYSVMGDEMKQYPKRLCRSGLKAAPQPPSVDDLVATGRK